MTPTDYMARALERARSAGAGGEVPVGAVLVDAASGEVLAEAANRTETDRDPAAHAELLVIREGCKTLDARMSYQSPPTIGRMEGGHSNTKPNNAPLLTSPLWGEELRATRPARFLEGCDLYVTLEPCAMCAAAISFARIRRLYYGAYDPKGGAVDHGPRFFSQPTCHHAPEVIGGIMERECGEVLKKFFKRRRGEML